MKKILFLVILIAQSACVTFAQNNETKTFQQVSSTVSRMYRDGYQVYFIREVTNDSINCSSPAVRSCDGRSVMMTHVDIVTDSTLYPLNDVLKAYVLPNYFIEQSYTEMTAPVKADFFFGMADLEIKTSQGYVYKKDENKIVFATRQSQGTPKVYFSVVASIVWSIVFAVSLLVRGKSHKRYKSGISLIKWTTFSYAITMTCFMMMNMLCGFYLHPNVNPLMIWILIGFLWIWFVMYHVIERIDIDLSTFQGAVKLLILATLITTIGIYDAFVGEIQLTVWLTEGICSLIVVILVYRQIFIRFPDSKFVNFLKTYLVNGFHT